MTPNAEAVAAGIDARVARARALALARPSTAVLLDFFARLSTWQRTLLPRAPEVLRALPSEGAPFAARLDVWAIASCVPELLTWLSHEGPTSLGDAARRMAADDADVWHVRLTASLGQSDDGPSDAPAAFVCEAVTQPFAEVVARAMVAGPAGAAPSPGEPATCPCCGGLPVAGVLRERGHGASRALVCGRCLSEWAAPRSMCPSCGGLDVEALPVFRADAWPAVRLDACERCHTYLKSVDLSVDGHAIAVVDDLATLSLDLWAGQQGFRKNRPNLLRV